MNKTIKWKGEYLIVTIPGDRKVSIPFSMVKLLADGRIKHKYYITKNEALVYYMRKLVEKSLKDKMCNSLG